MDPIQFNATARTEFGKGSARRLRRESLLPVVAYRNGDEPLHLTLDPKALMHQLNKTGRNTIFQFNIEGGDSHYAILQQMQRHPVTRRPMHVDFRLIDLDQEVNVMVNLNFTGRALGVRMGGRLLLVRRYLRVSCPATQIPDSIDADVTELAGGSTFYSGSVTGIPEQCTLLESARVPLCSIKGGTGDRSEEEGSEEGAE